jgi:4-hydroxy-2-oxoheptanedioate aldolase
MDRNITGLKKRLHKGDVVMGPWCVLPSASVINVIASAGPDFIIIDTEHGAFNYETIEDMIRAAQTENCSPLVRVAENNETLILKALDSGAEGVMVPHIGSKADAEKAIAFSKYYPIGQRGFSSFTRAGRYSLNNVRTHSRVQNQKTVLILMLEGRDGINSLGSILSIKDIEKTVDAVYIGAYDLSQALGLPGQVDHPEVKNRLKGCIAKIKAAGIAAGGYVAKNKADALWMRRMGMQFITSLPDCTVLYHAFEAMYRDFKGAKSK